MMLSQSGVVGVLEFVILYSVVWILFVANWLYVHSPSTPWLSQAFRLSVWPGRQWRGSNPRQKGLCRSQGGFAIHCVTDAPVCCRRSDVILQLSIVKNSSCL
ncbi:hypothetical protein PoB_005959200 [Plakobranchus ocellatus]|uniref:ATP synthase F0 subunit 8 n=1 Tax=Plakobranchus ocellatus TaxID=259542 RepID=A0AAV4CM99_9GAST|nr:hypothetical protein PoB_005959200 [Plakobranchus ocellatus]